VAPSDPTVTLFAAALDPAERVALKESGSDVTPGTPGVDWHELLDPDPSEGNDDDSEPSVGVGGSEGNEPSVDVDGNADVTVVLVGRLGAELDPAGVVPDPDPDRVTLPPEPLPDSEPPEDPTDPCTDVVELVRVGSPIVGRLGDPPPGRLPAPGRLGNAVSGSPGSPLAGSDAGSDWALAGAIEGLATSPPAMAPPTAQMMTPAVTATSRTCRRAAPRSEVTVPRRR
jgi:hypothetical protein